MLGAKLANKFLEVRRQYLRKGGIWYRQGITAVDKITDFANTDITTADNGSATGSLNANTTYDMTVIPGNKWGPCKVASTINTQATSASGVNTHSIRLTFGAATGAEWYDIFLSDAAAPLWVARVTEAQRAAGDYEVTAVGTVASGGGNPAGSIDVNVVGTGIATSNAVFAQNNAYRPERVPLLNCRGYSTAIVTVLLTLTDLRSAPTLRIMPFSKNPRSENGTDVWHALSIGTVSLLGALGQPLSAEFRLDVASDSQISLLVDTISGQGAAVDLWVDMTR